MGTRASLAVAVLTLGGCAVGPKYKAPTPAQLGVPSTWHSQTGSEASVMDLSRWWEQLDDAVLTFLIEDGLEENFDLKLAQTGLRESRARRDVAGAAAPRCARSRAQVSG